MSVRMDNVLIVVEDLQPVVEFFEEIGLEVEGRATNEGPWVDKVIGLEGASSDIVMLRPPDGHGGVELSKFHAPRAIVSEPANAPVNTVGLRRIMFGVDDLDDLVARLRARGAELVGEIAQYEDVYRLCFMRGPEGIIVGLAQRLG